MYIDQVCCNVYIAHDLIILILYAEGIKLLLFIFYLSYRSMLYSIIQTEFNTVQ